MEVSETQVYAENFGYQEQKMQVLKLFLPLLSLSGEEEAKFDQEATR